MAADLAAASLEELCTEARRLREAGHGSLVTYSPKVFIPLTKLCRDVCHYCTFARPPRRGERAYMSDEEVLDVARAGAAAGCHEALFTLGDKPELRYRAARDELAEVGCETTLEYLARCARLRARRDRAAATSEPRCAERGGSRRSAASECLAGTHARDGVGAAVSPGGPHFGSPDKLPARRLATIAAAGGGRRAVDDRDPDRHR